MSRTKGILIAASLTGLVLVTILVLGFGRVIASSDDVTGLATTPPHIASTGKSNGDLQQELKAWQQYAQELEQTLRNMQERETQYQQQLELANQTIVQLVDSLNSPNLLRFGSFLGEHEGHEFGEFDD